MFLSPKDHMLVLKEVFSFARCGIQVNFSSSPHMIIHAARSCTGLPKKKFVCC